ncbi:ATP-dependent DNA helicase RecQ-like [Saccostrea cucullata]|uniref:ATP-dependent DNA helicase RecQ-like n=1 Tax=Saccostrea cuccullata TaxID=36930 RepID=UPI002ED0CF74
MAAPIRKVERELDIKLKSEQVEILQSLVEKRDCMAVLPTGGDDDAQNGKKAFRRWFGELGELRSLFPSAPLMALSATCTQKIQRGVIKALALNHHTYVYKFPDKRNIKYSVKKVPGDIDMAWTWLVDGLMELRALFPKTLIYCKSISDVAKIYDYINDDVSKEFESFIGMFHSETESSLKERILLSIRDEQSLLRIIISTNAMGMGVDFKGLFNIVLYGPPCSMLDLVQEIGRGSLKMASVEVAA